MCCERESLAFKFACMVKKLIVSDMSVFVHYPDAVEKDLIRQENIKHSTEATQLPNDFSF